MPGRRCLELLRTWGLESWAGGVWFSANGEWYDWPHTFPAMFVTGTGYVIFETEDELRQYRQPAGHVVFNQRRGGIAALDDFVQMAASPVIDSVARAAPSPRQSRGSRANHANGRAERVLAYRSDADIPVWVTGGRRVMSQRHNTMTNTLKRLGEARGRTLIEIVSFYDVLEIGVCRDRLIEVKSEIGSRAIHEAMGQLLHYHEFCRRPALTDLALVLPARPDQSWIDTLLRRGIATLWFEGPLDVGPIHGIDFTRAYASRGNAHSVSLNPDEFSGSAAV